MKIHEYTPDAAVPGAIEGRHATESDTGNIGGAVAQLGSSLSTLSDAVHKQDALSEISDVSAKLANVHAEFTTGLTDTLQSATPGDKTISDKFIQNYDDQIANIGDNLSTPEARRYFERTNAQMRAHFLISSMEGQAALVGEKAKNDYVNATNSWSSSLLNDPSSFETATNIHGQMIQSLVDSKALSSKKAIELKTQGDSDLAKAAVRGWIQLDPTFAKKQLDEGKWNSYFNADQKYQLQRESEQGINAQLIEAKRREQAAKDALEKVQVAAQDSLLVKIANGTATKDDIFKGQGKVLAPFGSGSKEQFLKLIQTQSEQKIVTNPAVFIDTFQRIHAPDGTPNKILDENDLNNLLGKGLTLQNIMSLRGEIQGKKTQDGQVEAKLKDAFFESAKRALTKSNPFLGIPDPEGDTRYQLFLSSALEKYNALRKAGKSPKDLLTPGAPDSMWGDLDNFKPTPQEVMKSIGDQWKQPSSKGPLAPDSTTAQPGSTSETPSGLSPPSGVPVKGEIRNGYKFKGGEPSKQENWEKVK